MRRNLGGSCKTLRSTAAAEQAAREKLAPALIHFILYDCPINASFCEVLTLQRKHGVTGTLLKLEETCARLCERAYGQEHPQARYSPLEINL